MQTAPDYLFTLTFNNCSLKKSCLFRANYYILFLHTGYCLIVFILSSVQMKLNYMNKAKIPTAK